ncbi:MAG: tRNA pseudouridine32 synthase/23S rRNA pseudouridine746 synthase [Granulosicoccus sp.]
MVFSVNGPQSDPARLNVTTPQTEVPIVYEDDSMIIVNKPAGLLSQPGKTIVDSVVSRIEIAYKGVCNPTLVHRLDMDTSGLLMLAKNRLAHRNLQQQFEHRKIGKRYRAVLEHSIEGVGGRIHLPLRLDIDNRPSQIVCYQFGKSSTTVWHKDPEAQGNSVVLYPLTGRSHQLRVHLADPEGLGVAIKGDRLYGGASDAEPWSRMLLHADFIAFDHPVTGERVSIYSPAPFLE